MKIPERCILKPRDVRKTYSHDQDKIIPPHETLTRFRERLAGLELDILQETERIDNGRLDIPVYFSTCGKDAAAATGTRKQMGKGAAPGQAEASAVMELAERFSFFTFLGNPENFITEKLVNIKEDALPFSEIAQSVHDTSRDLEKAQQVFENLSLRWTWGYDLGAEKPVLIPFDWFYAINEFNGPSAGNCMEEAMVQGICEVVERHVCAMVSRNRLTLPAIRPESATDPAVMEMLEKYKRAGIEVFLSDFTMDMGIPTVGVLAYDPETFPEKSEMVWTAGTAPDPQKALSRALTETAQLAGDFNSGTNYVASGLPKLTSLSEAHFLTHPETHVAITDLPDISDQNLKTEIERAVSCICQRGMRVYCVNTTHPELQIPALYTIIPGARFRERTQGTGVGMFMAKLIAENHPPQEALEKIKEMEGVMGRKYYTRFQAGLSTLNMGKPREALFIFEEAIALDPTLQDLVSIYSYMGVGLKEMEAYKKALIVLKKGAAIDSGRTDIHNLIGFCHFKLKNHKAAIQAFEKVLAIDPGSAIDYANIATNYRELGDRDSAIEYYLKALTIDPSIEFARENLDKLRTGK